MVRLIFLIILAGLINSCSQNRLQGDNSHTDKELNILDEEKVNENKLLKEVTNGDIHTLIETETTSDQNITVKDSILSVDYSSLKAFDPDLNQISEDEFKSHLSHKQTSCTLDELGFFVQNECDEICEDYLVDSVAHLKMQLPSDYDAGILGLSASPDCNLILVYSSYDGPDYLDYYENRAEFYLFRLTEDKTLDKVKPVLKYGTKDWSINHIIWINDNTIALQLYQKQRWDDKTDLDYRYFETTISH